MKYYNVIVPVTLFCGLIVLTDDQAKPRAHCLKKTVSKGVYEIVQKVVFKAGEMIGLEQVSKANEPNLFDLAAAEEASKAEEARRRADERAAQRAAKEAEKKAQ